MVPALDAVTPGIGAVAHDVEVHSQTLPARSKIPSGDAGVEATFAVPRPVQTLFGGRPNTALSHEGGVFPHGYSVAPWPLAAASHSSSVGKRLPAKAQYAFA